MKIIILDKMIETDYIYLIGEVIMSTDLSLPGAPISACFDISIYNQTIPIRISHPKSIPAVHSETEITILKKAESELTKLRDELVGLWKGSPSNIHKLTL
jgi:hypothetical protein